MYGFHTPLALPESLRHHIRDENTHTAKSVWVDLAGVVIVNVLAAHSWGLISINLIQLLINPKVTASNAFSIMSKVQVFFQLDWHQYWSFVFERRSSLPYWFHTPLVWDIHTWGLVSSFNIPDSLCSAWFSIHGQRVLSDPMYASLADGHICQDLGAEIVVVGATT